MATGSNKDVKLTLSVETLGDADIKALKTAVLSLAQSGTDAAPEFQKLADQIDRLGEQNDALQSFKALNAEVDELAVKQAAAAARVTDLKTKLDAQATSVNDAKQRQSEAKAELDRLAAAYRAAGVEIAAYKAETDKATKDTQGYRDTLRDLVRAKGEAKDAEVQQRIALKATNDEVAKADAEYRKLEGSYDRASKSAKTLGDALDKQNQALEAATRASEELGASTTDVAASEARLVAAFNDAATAVNRSNTEMAEAAAQAKATAAAQADLIASLNNEIKFRQQQSAARDEANQAAQFEVALSRDLSAELEKAAAAAQRKIAATIEMAEADRLLAAEQQGLNDLYRRGADALQAEEAAIREATQTSNLYVAQKREQANAEQAAAAAAQQAADKIENAFKTTGVRSVEALNAEIAELRAAMGTLQERAAATGQSFSGAFAQGQTKIAALERELRELNGTLTTTDRLSGLLKNSLGQIAAGNLIADGVGYLVNKVKELAAAFVDTIAQSQALTRAMNAIYKDTATTAAQIDFLRTTALNAGVAVGGIQQAFIKFSAATQSANIPIQQTNELFAALVKAGGTLGLSSDQVSGALEALGQMASKGTVSMEELRQQLGDRLPGALSLSAKGLGLTEAELIKLVETGSLAARDLFPALTQALKTMHGEVSGITPAWENFKNILSGIATDAGDAGWATILEGALKLLGGTVGAVALAFSTLWEGMRITGIAALALFETFRGNGTEAFAFLNVEIDKTNLRLEKQQLRLEQMINPTEQVRLRLQELSAQQTSSGKAAEVAAAGTQKLQEVTALTAEGQVALQAAMGVTADTYVRATDEITKQITAAEKQAESAGKNVKAAQDEGAALEALAKLRGEDRAELEASVRAKELELVAQEKVSVAKQREADLLNVQKALLIDTANARGLTQQQLDGEVQKLDQKIQKAEAEAAQARGTLSNLQLEVATRQAAVQTYGDQSAAVDKLRQAMEAAEAVAAITRQGEKDGLATKEQVRAADIAAAQARAVYNDALRDSVATITQVAQVEQAKANVQAAGLAVQQSAYNLLAQSARASGDYAGAIYYEVQAKRIQIQVTELQARAKKLEAQAEMEAIEAERQALIATNSLTDAKKRELEIRSLNAKAKAIEAGASAEIVRALEREVTAILNSSNALSSNNNSRSSNARAIDGQTASLTRLNAERQREAELQQASANDPYGRSPEQIKNLRQQGGPVDASYVFDIERRLRAGEDFSPEEIPALANAARVARENAMLGGPGSVSPAGRDDNAKWVNITRLALERAEGAKQAAEMAARRGAPRPNAPTYTPAPNAPAAPAGGTVTVNLNLNGQTTSIRTSSQADADRLANFMRSLERAAGTSS